ncbi:MAG: M67 family metallopeptidase [Candidatus Marinimicrobia bacterium]|nr:M67 family metallopeptidase [Candidatus Neomarinimicrobiota bacterium]MCF7827527.1 M67 family metallopeptidase [Candidatus Neomarinimicrobiota bacterium]MCF7881611.1 M67 family metallopeptidase [Candidatus Neomarinimicrobiota bacterium]
MTVKLSKEITQEIYDHGEKDYPYECCGFLIGKQDGDDRIITEIRRQPNQREDSQETRFLIQPEEFRDAERYAKETGQEMLGIYHSHPESPARPSEYDRNHAWPWYSYLILSVRDGEAAEMYGWQLRDDRSQFDEIPLELESTE